MTRDLRNVRHQPAPDAPTPLSAEEEARYRNLLFTELGNKIADDGWARYPAHTPEERRRLIEVAARLTAHWGQQVFIEPEDQTRFRLCLAGHQTLPS
ncbi:hypothetical protein [Streptomyces sp. NPDC051561]|uniref:hypothetical protein n=1 Tax=Streptomyces sp. NPDC051561 TaxID=3365658 RepID=UPI003796DCD6